MTLANKHEKERSDKIQQFDTESCSENIVLVQKYRKNLEEELTKEYDEVKNKNEENEVSI